MIRRRGGFTLIEAVISLLLSSLVVVLVATTFLVQNRYYATQIQRTGAHDNARGATDVMASEIRSVMADGIVTAGARTLTVRSPMMLAVVCAQQGFTVHVHSDGGQAALDTAEVAGVARRDTLSGAWTYASTNWNTINGADGQSAAQCEANGADTVGIRDDFHRLRALTPLTGYPDLNDVLMLYREVTYQFATSTMDTTVVGLFRAEGGGSFVEYATGFDTSARFQYRTAPGVYSDTVVAANLGNIDVVRFIADALKPAPTGGVDDVTFGWSVNIALRNLR